jgi:integrase/recombinase XerD
LDAKNNIILQKSNNIILRGEKTKSGYSLFFDIHIKGKRIREYLRINISTSLKKDYTQTDRDMIRIAQKLLAKRVVEIAEGIYPNNQVFNANTNVNKYFESLKDERINNKDKSKYKWIGAYKYFIQFVGKKQINFRDISRALLDGYRAFLLSKIAQNSASSYFSILSQMFEKAKIDKIIQFNPMSEVKSIRQTDTLKVYLTLDELSILIHTGNLDENGKELFPIISKKAFIFACFTGFRFNDVRILKGNQIRKENGNHYLYYISGKSKKPDRLKLHPLASEQLSNIDQDGLAFPGLVTKDYINDHLKILAEKAKIKKHVTSHVAKHTFATMALNSGVDIYTLKELLHHSDIRTTEIYAKLLSESKDKAIDKLPTFI